MLRSCLSWELIRIVRLRLLYTFSFVKRMWKTLCIWLSLKFQTLYLGILKQIVEKRDSVLSDHNSYGR
jgi:hypothetical protein